MVLKKNTSDAIDVHELRDPLSLALWAIDQMTSRGKDRFSAALIANHLVETHGVSVSRQAVAEALTGGTKYCHRNISGYKLMEAGREYLKNQAAEVNSAVVIEPGKPFTAKRVKLKSMFSSITGVVRICDPYIDIKTLDVIHAQFSSGIEIQVLTTTVVDKPAGSFARALQDLRTEGYKIEVGTYPKDLHDRYIMDDKTFWHSGNSLNHLGSKESLITRLGADVLQSMLATFNSRWKVASKI